MKEFFIETLLWTFAFYGIFEFIKHIIYVCTYTKCRTEGINVIITVKNQEDEIEGFLRSTLFKVLYGKEQLVRNIIVADLKSSDNSRKIAQKMEQDYNFLKVISWKECKEIIDMLDEN